MSRFPTGPGVHLPPPTLFVLGLGGGWLLHRAYPVALLPASWRGFAVASGWTLLGFWLVLLVWAVATFAAARTTIVPNRPATRLVTSGPYRLTRNPMYVSLTALYAGMTLLIDSAWIALLLPFVLAALNFWVIRSEERYLAAEFGEEYEVFRSRVRRWL